MTEAQVFQEFMRRFQEGTPPRPAAVAELDRMATELATRLPGAYSRFMTRYGGAYTPSLLGYVSDESEERGEEVFDIQNIESIEHAISGTKAYWEGGMPDNLIGIANDCSGNLYCFERLPMGSATPDDVPIVLFDHDYDEVRPIAPSFVQLLQSFLRFAGNAD